jgi:hypothetical protein
MAIWHDTVLHWPFWQLVPVVHVLPQVPQLLGSVCRSAHPLGHWVAWHEQLPLEHVSAARHVCPQPPQFFESVCMSVQTPPQHAGGPSPPEQ